jgi:hypothetical protein
VHDPIFILDSREKFQPLAVESVPASGAGLIENDGTRRDEVDLAALPEAGGRIDFPPNPETKEQELRPRFGGVGYRREQKGGGLTWIQYWLWYLYNPKRFLITGEHEGDWEFAQVGYVGETPICMTLSQHHSGGARMWWNVQRRDGRPLVYVARDSHANFFRPIDQIPEFGDEADGKGARPRVDRLRRRLVGLEGALGQLDRAGSLAAVAGLPGRPLECAAPLPHDVANPALNELGPAPPQTLAKRRSASRASAA